MKAQVSVEGMGTMAIVLSIFAILVFATLSAQETSARLQEFLEKREACISLSNDLYSAFLLGGGTKVTVRISGLVDIVNDTVYVKKSAVDQPVVCSSRVHVLDANLLIGDAEIKNTNGIVVVNNV
jgi:hypothetical protein